MKMKCRLLVALAAVACAAGVFAYDYDVVDSRLGDCRLVTLGGYTLARPLTVGFPVVSGEDGAATNFPCSLDCQIVYRGARVLEPTDDDWERMQLTDELLNAWLSAYLRESYAEADLNGLCESYLSGEFVKGLQRSFPDYVGAKISAMDPAHRIRIETVTVTVRAAGAFRRELVRRLRLLSGRSEN